MLLLINVILAVSAWRPSAWRVDSPWGWPPTGLRYSMRSANQPLYTAWINQSLQPSIRATVFSMSSQLDALGQIAGGPLIGLLGTAISIGAAMIASAATLIPALFLYARTSLHGERATNQSVMDVSGK